jgi:hypothetical protein
MRSAASLGRHLLLAVLLGMVPTLALGLGLALAR